MAVTRLAVWGAPTAPPMGSNATASAAISGTATQGMSENAVVNGGRTIIITLTDDEWVGAGSTFDAQRQNIIDGLDSAQSEAAGWNAEVRDNEVVGAVVRDTPTRVTITLSASAGYSVDNNETITVTVPATAVLKNQAITGSPTFGVTASSGIRHLSQVRRHNETDMRHTDSTLRHEDNTLDHQS